MKRSTVMILLVAELAVSSLAFAAPSGATSHPQLSKSRQTVASTTSTCSPGNWCYYPVSPGPNCPNGLICLFSQDNYSGEECDVVASSYSGQRWQNLGSSVPDICVVNRRGKFNDKLASWKNNSNLDGNWASQFDGGGNVQCMNANGQNNGVASPGTASSIKVHTDSNFC
jgi:hypothetical protein